MKKLNLLAQLLKLVFGYYTSICSLLLFATIQLAPVSSLSLYELISQSGKSTSKSGLQANYSDNEYPCFIGTKCIIGSIGSMT